jgi:hypothetical protein
MNFFKLTSKSTKYLPAIVGFVRAIIAIYTFIVNYRVINLEYETVSDFNALEINAEVSKGSTFVRRFYF